MSRKTSGFAHLLAPGAHLLIRDQEWAVQSTGRTHGKDYLIEVTGLTPSVRDV